MPHRNDVNSAQDCALDDPEQPKQEDSAQDYAPKDIGPPHEDGAPKGPAGSSGTSTTPTRSKPTAAVGQLCARRAAAVRLVGGDPENPGTRCHRPSTGLRASGFREGYVACLRWVQDELGEHLDPIGRELLAAILTRSEAA